MNRSMLALPLLLALPVMAQAQPVSGLYVGAGAGADVMVDQITKTHFGLLGNSAVQSFKNRQRFDTGVMAQGSVGYGLGNGIRLEVEGLYTSNQLTGSAFYQQKYGVLANALFDFDIGSPYIFPYAGLGGGYVHVDRDFGFQKDTGAYQAIAGASFPIPFVVGLSATLDYRFLGVADAKKTYRIATGVGSYITQEKALNNLSNVVMVGLRYQFNVVPPPPPAAPVAAAPVSAAPSRTYLVFFDWDRADLTARARQVIAEAASNAAKIQYTRIEVAGNADRSGTPAYNVGLSRRRAESVAGELVRLGISRQVIDIQAYGDTRPLVPTAAGVREPQNRRVEIVIH